MVERSPTDRLLLADKQAGLIFGKMEPGRLIRKEVAKLDERLVHELWDGNNSAHTALPRVAE